MNLAKYNIPIYWRKNLEYYSPPLPNIACPQETTRIELEGFHSSNGVWDVMRNIFPMWILHPQAIIQTKWATSQQGNSGKSPSTSSSGNEGGLKIWTGKHHSSPHAVLLSTHDKCRVCVDPGLQNYFPQMAKWRKILQRVLLQHWRTS